MGVRKISRKGGGLYNDEENRVVVLDFNLFTFIIFLISIFLFSVFSCHPKRVRGGGRSERYFLLAHFLPFPFLFSCF